jgi:hypothetical protein
MAIKSIIELIYLLAAGPILAYVGIKGLKQLKILKKHFRLNSMREAFKVAAEQCNHFSKEIIPLYRKFMKEIDDNNIKFLDNFEINIKKNHYKVSPTEDIATADLNALNSSEYLTDLLNNIEGYSLYYASRVADEKVGYITTGKCYCEMVMKLLPLFITEFQKGYFKNTSLIFGIWYNRQQKEKLTLEKKQLEKEIKEIPAGSISAIGTN